MSTSKRINLSAYTITILVVLLLLLMYVNIKTTKAQLLQKEPNNFDLNISIGTHLAKSGIQPLWNYARGYGTILPFDNGVTKRIGGEYKRRLNEKIDISLGATSFLRHSADTKFYMQEYYLQSDIYFLRFKAGRKKEKADVPVQRLSVGTFGINSQTTPIPEVKAEVPNFTPVPFTWDILWFKGELSHAWLEEDRYVESSFLHYKDFYLSLYREDFLPVRARAGINHYVQWGGMHPDGQLGNSWEDYYRVFTGKGAESSPKQGEVSNAQGNHLGYWDFGLDAYPVGLKTGIYWMHPFDDGSGLWFRNIGDGIFGYYMKNEGRFPEWFENFVIEFIYTKDQTSPGIPDRPDDYEGKFDPYGNRFNGRDNYYNNHIYQSGWTYHNLNIGMPLYISRKQQTNYLGKNTLETIWEFTSNRVKAYHLGLSGKMIHVPINIKLNLTYALQSGTYYGLDNAVGEEDFRARPELKDNYVFYPALKQFYSQLALQYSVTEQYTVDLSLGVDSGELYDTIGVVAGVTASF